MLSKYCIFFVKLSIGYHRFIFGGPLKDLTNLIHPSSVSVSKVLPYICMIVDINLSNFQKKKKNIEIQLARA